MNKQGLLVIISSPAGGGKDSVIRGLLKIFKNSIRLTTTTSRPPRPRDKQGIEYAFISKEEFKIKINQGYFLEYNNCVGNYYGIPKKYFTKLQDKYDVIFTNIDVNGKKHFDELKIPHLSIFLLPENTEVLRQRAGRRGGMTEQMIADRIKLGLEEIAKSKTYDYKVINYEGKLIKTVQKVAKIIQNRFDLGNVDKNK